MSIMSGVHARTPTCAGCAPKQQPIRAGINGSWAPNTPAPSSVRQMLQLPCQLSLTSTARRRHCGTRRPLRAQHPAHELERELTDAVNAEDYVRAAALRDELRALKAQNPLSSLQQQLKVRIEDGYWSCTCQVQPLPQIVNSRRVWTEPTLVLGMQDAISGEQFQVRLRQCLRCCPRSVIKGACFGIVMHSLELAGFRCRRPPV